MVEAKAVLFENESKNERSSCSKEKPERSSVRNDGTANKDERGSSKGKQPAKKPAKNANEKAAVMAEDKILMAVACLQNTLDKQNQRMNAQDKKIEEQNNQLKDIFEKMTSYGEYEEADEYEYDECGDHVVGQPSCDEIVTEHSEKRPIEDVNNNNRFSTMAKRFKSTETCDKAIDSVLADNITELFRNGMDEARYVDLTKDENTGRPENCEGLCVVQTNQSVWDIIGPVARINDKKMQCIETSVIKGATILAKVVDKMAKMEDSIENEGFSALIDECNDVLALLGHSNKQINLARKDFLKPAINRDYSYLCNHRIPFTRLLFGDDVSKSAKEIEDTSKLSNRLTFSQRPFRGGPMRRRMGRSSRFRGGYGRGSRGAYYAEASTSSFGMGPKNFPRRGARPQQQ